MTWDHLIYFAVAAAFFWIAGSVTSFFDRRKASLWSLIVFSTGNYHLRLFYYRFLDISKTTATGHHGRNPVMVFPVPDPGRPYHLHPLEIQMGPLPDDSYGACFSCDQYFAARDPQPCPDARPAKHLVHSHVTVYMFSYALLACTFLLALAGLIRPSLNVLDAIDKLCRAGLSFFTIGMLLGALWAKQAWEITGAGTRKKPGCPNLAIVCVFFSY
jgi:hypothetical protein